MLGGTNKGKLTLGERYKIGEKGRGLYRVPRKDIVLFAPSPKKRDQGGKKSEKGVLSFANPERLFIGSRSMVLIDRKGKNIKQELGVRLRPALLHSTEKIRGGKSRKIFYKK